MFIDSEKWKRKFHFSVLLVSFPLVNRLRSSLDMESQEREDTILGFFDVTQNFPCHG